MPQTLQKSQEQQGNSATHLAWGFPQPFTSISLLPLAVVGISSTFEPCDPVHLQSVLPFTGPLIRRLDPSKTALEAGHDVAGEQFIAMQGFFPRRPVGHPDHEATKSPADFLQAFDASDAIV